MISALKDSRRSRLSVNIFETELVNYYGKPKMNWKSETDVLSKWSNEKESYVQMDPNSR